MRLDEFTMLAEAGVCVGSEAAGKECCRRCAACGGESAADGVQLVGEAAEPAMSELSILILIMVMRQIHRIYCSGVGDL